jgi:hypothetical protein
MVLPCTKVVENKPLYYRMHLAMANVFSRDSLSLPQGIRVKGTKKIIGVLDKAAS